MCCLKKGIPRKESQMCVFLRAYYVPHTMLSAEGLPSLFSTAAVGQRCRIVLI